MFFSLVVLVYESALGSRVLRLDICKSLFFLLSFLAQSIWLVLASQHERACNIDINFRLEIHINKKKKKERTNNYSCFLYNQLRKKSSMHIENHFFLLLRQILFSVTLQAYCPPPSPLPLLRELHGRNFESYQRAQDTPGPNSLPPVSFPESRGYGDARNVL